MAYIDVDKARKHLRVDCLAKYPTTYIDGLLAAAEELTRIPTADVVEVRHGEWKASVMSTGAPHCSLCNGVALSRYTFCPHCGAKMDERSNT